MEQFKRLPTIRMTMAELMGTTIQLQNGEKDTYQPSIFLSPTGAEVNKVIVAGVAVEREDVGTDNPFWRVRIVDPTGASFVYAGQYQPEASKAIQRIEVPSFVVVSGKLSHYTPEQGGETIVSIRAESISAVPLEIRDHTLVDIAVHTLNRIKTAKDNKNVQCYYSNYDFKSLVNSISAMLDQVIEDSAQAGAATPASPPVQEKKEPELQKAPEAKQPEKPLEAKQPETPKETSKPPVQEPPKEAAKPPAEPPKTPAAEKKKKPSKKDAAKPPQEPPKEAPKEVPKPQVQEPPKEAPKEEPKPGNTPNVLGDSEKMVLDILKTHKPQGALSKDTIANVLRALGYAMLNVDAILARLKAAGEIIEPKNGSYQAV